MKNSFVSLAAALLLPAAGAFAQLPTSATYSQRAGSSSPVATASVGPRYHTRSVGGGSITYFGAVCSHDAQHEQFVELRQAFEASKPTAVFFENPDCGTDSTETATINRAGAAGYARFLAHQHQVPVERLDNPLAEYEYLRTKIDPERLKLFYLLRETQRRARPGASKALTVKVMKQLLANSAYFLPGTEQVIHNMTELGTAYQKYCPDGGKWWKMPADWFSPGVAAAGTGSAFINDLTGAIGEFRDRYIYRKLADMAQAGQRVFVVVGRDHVPAPAPALASK